MTCLDMASSEAVLPFISSIFHAFQQYSETYLVTRTVIHLPSSLAFGRFAYCKDSVAKTKVPQKWTLLYVYGPNCSKEALALPLVIVQA